MGDAMDPIVLPPLPGGGGIPTMTPATNPLTPWMMAGAAAMALVALGAKNSKRLRRRAPDSAIWLALAVIGGVAYMTGRAS